MLTLWLVGISVLIASLWPGEVMGAETALYGELVNKAKAERTVEYWSPTEKEYAEEILRGFTKRYGIETKFRFWRGTGPQQRTLVELQAGRAVSADLMSPGREAQQQFLDAGVFEKPPFEYLKVWPKIDKRQYDPSGWALNLTGNSRAVAYNSKLVPPALVPKTWDDCARPEFKGKAVLDPRDKLYALQWNRREWFLNWVKRMVANDVKLIREQTETIQLLSSGAYALFCSAQPYTYYRMVKEVPQIGDTVKVAVPGEFLLEAGSAAFIRKNSPKPYAAQLLAGWLASDEGQRLIDRIYFQGFPWVDGTYNAKLAKGHKILFCDPECAAKAGEMSREYVRALGLPMTE